MPVRGNNGSTFDEQVELEIAIRRVISKFCRFIVFSFISAHPTFLGFYGMVSSRVLGNLETTIQYETQVEICYFVQQYIPIFCTSYLLEINLEKQDSFYLIQKQGYKIPYLIFYWGFNPLFVIGLSRHFGIFSIEKSQSSGSLYIVFSYM